MAAVHPSEREVARRPVKPVGVALALFGALALAGGTWVLRAPDAFRGLIEAMLADLPLRVAIVLALWVAFLTVAAYITLHWRMLRWWEMAAGWLLVAWLWAGGLLLVYAPQIQFSPRLVPLLTDPVTLRAAGLLSLAGGATLLGLAFALWPPPARRPRPHHHPRIVRTVHHPRPV